MRNINWYFTRLISNFVKDRYNTFEILAYSFSRYVEYIYEHIWMTFLLLKEYNDTAEAFKIDFVNLYFFNTWDYLRKGFFLI